MGVPDSDPGPRSVNSGVGFWVSVPQVVTPPTRVLEGPSPGGVDWLPGASGRAGQRLRSGRVPRRMSVVTTTGPLDGSGTKRGGGLRGSRLRSPLEQESCVDRAPPSWGGLGQVDVRGRARGMDRRTDRTADEQSQYVCVPPRWTAPHTED